jgi:hypothetical protein
MFNILRNNTLLAEKVKYSMRRLGRTLVCALISSVALFGVAQSSAHAVGPDGWRTWDDMQSGGFAVTYGAPARIYDCFLGKFRVSLQAKNARGAWVSLQTVTTKKSQRCDGDYAAMFNGAIGMLGTQLDDTLYLEMRMFSPASRGFREFRSRPALVPQYKSERDRLRSIFEGIDKALSGL